LQRFAVTRAVDGMNLPQLDGVKCSLTDAIATKQDILAALPTLIVEGVLTQKPLRYVPTQLRTEISELQEN